MVICFYAFDHVYVTYMLYIISGRIHMPWLDIFDHVYVTQINICDVMLNLFIFFYVIIVGIC
jgi:hypothetical protein